jgi:hypothetical protein
MKPKINQGISPFFGWKMEFEKFLFSTQGKNFAIKKELYLGRPVNLKFTFLFFV